MRNTMKNGERNMGKANGKVKLKHSRAKNGKSGNPEHESTKEELKADEGQLWGLKGKNTQVEDVLNQECAINELLLDSLPHPAMLIRKDKIVLAANRISREIGAKISGYCWCDIGQSNCIPPKDKKFINDHKKIPPGGTRCLFCLADEALKKQKPLKSPEINAWGEIWDMHWIPLNKEIYLHYAIDPTKRRQTEETLKAANQQLRASEQQLKAANTQLKKDEQQLRAANQQLQATEQQLKAANTQLRKDERQLRTSNQQLQATEQQLKTANTQLKKDEQQLRASNQQLQATEQQLRAANQQLLADQEELGRLNYILEQRVKELNCLFGLSHLAERRDITLDEIFHGLADLISQGWQYPEITAVRITYNGYRYKTDNFRKTAWIQSANIKVHNQKAGIIEVCYRKKRPVIDEGPFTKIERNLLDALAERLGTIIERKQAEEALKAANQQLIADEQQLRAANEQLKADEQQLKAFNQQLQATEQQLNAANQQLKADEQQLRAVNQQLKANEKELKNKQKQLWALTMKLSSIEERERRHIAESIHDSVIQPLVFLDVKVKSLLKKSKDSFLTESFNQMRGILSGLIEKSRSFTFDLSYPILNELGLETAIEEWMKMEIEEKHNIKTVFTGDGQSKDLGQNMSTFLFKCVKELLVNVVKHAQASRVKVSLAKDKEKNIIVVCVGDNGCGFTTGKHKQKYDKLSGYGLFNIRERLTYLGGGVYINSKPGKGSTVVLTLPLKAGG